MKRKFFAAAVMLMLIMAITAFADVEPVIIAEVEPALNMIAHIATSNNNGKHFESDVKINGEGGYKYYVNSYGWHPEGEDLTFCFTKPFEVKVSDYTELHFEIEYNCWSGTDHLISDTDSKVFVSFDDGETWSEKYAAVTYKDSGKTCYLPSGSGGKIYLGTSGNLLELAEDDDVITNVMIAPVAHGKNPIGAMRIVSMKVVGTPDPAAPAETAPVTAAPAPVETASPDETVPAEDTAAASAEAPAKSGGNNALYIAIIAAVTVAAVVVMLIVKKKITSK